MYLNTCSNYEFGSIGQLDTTAHSRLKMCKKATVRVFLSALCGKIMFAQDLSFNIPQDLSRAHPFETAKTVQSAASCAPLVARSIMLPQPMVSVPRYFACMYSGTKRATRLASNLKTNQGASMVQSFQLVALSPPVH